MASALQVYERRAARLTDALDARFTTGAAVLVDGVTYPATDAGTLALERAIELSVYKAAEIAILSGLNEYTILGRSFKRPSLELVQRRLRELEDIAVRATRVGIPLKQIVPLSG